MERLIQAARAGSLQALGELLTAYRPLLLLLARHKLHPSLQAKVGASDIVQDTFLEAQRDFGGFRGQTHAELVTWLRHILAHNVSNLARQYLDTDKRQVGREVPLDVPRPQGSRHWEPPAPGPTPSVMAMGQEQTQQVERALEQLPAHYRTILRQRHQEGRSFAEIGETLGASAEAARKLWCRAIERLQQVLLEDQ